MNRSAKPHARTPVDAEADAWAEVLVRYGLLHAAAALPSGQWLIQDRRDGPVRVLAGPAALLALAALIQHRTRTTRTRSR